MLHDQVNHGSQITRSCIYSGSKESDELVEEVFVGVSHFSFLLRLQTVPGNRLDDIVGVFGIISLLDFLLDFLHSVFDDLLAPTPENLPAVVQVSVLLAKSPSHITGSEQVVREF